MKTFFKKYRHGLVLSIYGIVYILAFRYLETRPIHGYHIVHTVFDDMIPFCEYFIIPYLLWFPYMLLAVIYFVFFNKNPTFSYILPLGEYQLVLEDEWEQYLKSLEKRESKNLLIAKSWKNPYRQRPNFLKRKHLYGF